MALQERSFGELSPLFPHCHPLAGGFFPIFSKLLQKQCFFESWNALPHMWRRDRAMDSGQLGQAFHFAQPVSSETYPPMPHCLESGGLQASGETHVAIDRYFEGANRQSS